MKPASGRKNTDPPEEKIKDNKLVSELKAQNLALKNRLRKKSAELKQLEEISHLMPGAFFQFSADRKGDYRMDYLSKGAEKIFNKPISELQDPDKMMHGLHPDDKEEFLLSIKKSMDEMSLWDHMYRVKSNRDNSYLWIHGKSQPEKASDGKVIWNGLLLDVTHQKTTEQEVYRQKDKFELLVNRIIDGYAKHRIICDERGKAIDYETIDVNRAYLDVLDIKRSNIVDKRVSEIISHKELEKWLKIFGPVALNGETKKYIIYSEKFEKYFEGTAFRNEKGFFEVVFVDITEKKKFEEEIKQHNSFLNAIIDNSPIPTFITDKEGTLIRTNESLLKHLNIVKEDVIGIYNLLHDENLFKQNLKPKIRDVFQKGKSTRFTMKWFGARSGFSSLSGSNNPWIDVTMYPIQDKNGNLTNVVCQWIDITEQVKNENDLKEAKQKLEESDYRLMLAVDSGELGIWDWDIQKDNMVWNNRMFLLYGIEEHVFTGKVDAWRNALHPDDEEQALRELQLALKNEKEFDTSFRIVHPDNTVLYIKADAIVIRNKNNEPIRMIGINHDVTKYVTYETELVKAKEKAEESEKIYHELFNNLSSGVAVFEVVYGGKDFIFRLFNDAAERIDRQSRDELIGKSISEVRPEIEKFGLIDTFKKVLQYKEPLHHPIKIYKEDILEGYYENYVFLLPSGELVAVFDDVTERVKFENDLKLAKEKAEDNETKLKESQAIAKLGGWELDIETGIFTFTENFYKIFKTSAEEMGGYQMSIREYVSRFVHPDDVQLVEKETKEAIETNDPQYTKYIEHKIKYKDGSIGFVGVRIFVKKSVSGKTVKTNGVNQDITDRKIKEQELIKAKEKAEEADKLKSAFLANMSHEIRTPMNGILGFTNLLKEKNLTGEDQIKFIEIIKKSGIRLLNTVNDIIEISRIETGQVKKSLKNVNISNHILTLCDFFSYEAEKKGLKLEIENNLTDEESTIKTDKTKISSIISNLIKNAIKFTTHGTIKIGCIKKDKLLEFYVKDTGIGIPENRREAIFNRFEQADLEDSNAFEGSGLGLSISKSYIEMLGGKIWVESEENKGSSFYFTVPYISDPPKSSKEKKNKAKQGNDINSKKLRILVAEDDEVSKIHLDIILKGVAREVIFVSTGQNVIDSLKKDHGFDLILMDIRMPEMDGLEATKKIREFNNEVIIIAQTAFALEGDRQKAIDAGCNDYISKPFNKKDLLALIEKYF